MKNHCYILNKCDSEVLEFFVVSVSIIAMISSIYTIIIYPKNKFSYKLVTLLCLSDLLTHLFIIGFPYDE